MTASTDRLTARLRVLESNLAAEAFRAAIGKAIEVLDAGEAKFNPYHDRLGRFTFAPGNGPGGGQIISASSRTESEHETPISRLKESTYRATFAPNRSAWVERVRLIAPNLSDAEINNLFDQMMHKASMNGAYEKALKGLFDLQKMKVYVQGRNHKKLDYIVMSDNHYRVLHSLFKDSGTREGMRAADELEVLRKSGKIRAR